MRKEKKRCRVCQLCRNVVFIKDVKGA